MYVQKVEISCRDTVISAGEAVVESNSAAQNKSHVWGHAGDRGQHRD